MGQRWLAVAGILMAVGCTCARAEPPGGLAAQTVDASRTFGVSDHTGEGWSCCVSFSPDGKTLAVGGADNTLRLWEVTTGRLRLSLEGHTETVHAVAFSPDGRHLASGSSDGTVRLWAWDAAGGTAKEAACLTAEGAVRSVAFSPDGKSVASGGVGKICLWETATGACRLRLPGARGNETVLSMAFSPDGRVLASGGGDTKVRLWDVKRGKPLQVLEGPETMWYSLIPPDNAGNTVFAIAFSPDGKTLASVHMDGTRLWSLATGAQSRFLPMCKGGTVAFSPGGKLLAVGGEELGLWDDGTGEKRMLLQGHRGGIESLAFSPDGKVVVAAGRGGVVYLWEIGNA